MTPENRNDIESRLEKLVAQYVKTRDHSLVDQMARLTAQLAKLQIQEGDTFGDKRAER